MNSPTEEMTEEVGETISNENVPEVIDGVKSGSATEEKSDPEPVREEILAEIGQDENQATYFQALVEKYPELRQTWKEVCTMGESRWTDFSMSGKIWISMAVIMLLVAGGLYYMYNLSLRPEPVPTWGCRLAYLYNLCSNAFDFVYRDWVLPVYVEILSRLLDPDEPYSIPSLNLAISNRVERFIIHDIHYLYHTFSTKYEEVSSVIWRVSSRLYDVISKFWA